MLLYTKALKNLPFNEEVEERIRNDNYMTGKLTLFSNDTNAKKHIWYY